MAQPLQRSVGRAALLHGPPARGLHLHGLLPRHRTLLLRPAAHHASHRPLKLRRHHEVVPLPVHLHRHGHADDGHELERVQMLLRVQRPGHQRHAVPHALQRRVPPAVRNEAADGGVRQYLLLRGPRRPHQAPPLRPLQEPRREELVQVRVRRVPRAGGRRAAQRPQEAVPAALQPRGHLVRLGSVEPSQAPEAKEHHRRPGLRVEPPDARLVRRFDGVADHRTDRVQRRRASSGHAPACGYRGEESRLERVHRVNDDAVGVHETTAVVHEPRVVRALLVSQEPRNRPRGNRRHAGDVHGAVVGRVGVDCQRRQAQSEREQRGRGREVDIRGHGELAGRVDDGGGEEVYDERRGAEFRHGGPDVGRVQLHVAGLELLQVAGAVRGRGDGGEVVEPDAEPGGGGRDAPDVRVDLRGRLGRRWLDNQHGDGEPVSAASEQPLASLDERHEVARAGLREEEHVGARHCSTLSGKT
ncbi:hypothetical protein CFC21_031981 [Triticum aestivum]|uniref:Uncharacterized protein n=2 Tax=Triticum aestivum TaxID=4565 RepID=A0A3B6DNU9_WHEAT|nr:hypothetical protein CFC21_031981 [Triticum aestivum]